MEENDYSPYELAVTSAILDESDFERVASIAACKKAHDECVKESGHSIHAKAKCFFKFAWCVAKHVAGCSTPCMPKFAICMMGATGNWAKTLACATEFITCAKHECTKESLLVISS